MRFTTFSYLEPLKLVATFQYVTAFSLDSSYRRCRVWYGMVTILWAPCQLVHYCVRHTKCNWPSIFLLLGQKLIQFELSFNSNISEIFLLFQKNDFFTASRSPGSSQLCCDKPSLLGLSWFWYLYT